MLTIRWTRRTRAVLVGAALVLAVGGAALVGLWEVSASPRFCSSCHIMQPYVDAWKVSKHSQVPCVQCHYPPGVRDTLWVKFQAISQVAKWATRTYSSKPFAEVEDASCFRSGCHSRARIEGRGVVTFARQIKFDHRAHLDPARAGRQLRCTNCHAQIVVNKHFEVTTAPCFLCHFKNTQSGRDLTPISGCIGCHEPPRQDVVVGTVTFNHGEMVRRGVACVKCHLNVVEGQGDVPRERCFGCHNQAEKIERYGERDRLHTTHTTMHPIECTRCHTAIKHRSPPPIGPPTAAADRPERGVVAGVRTP